MPLITEGPAILENQNLSADRHKSARYRTSFIYKEDQTLTINNVPGPIRRGVDPDIYKSYRLGLDSACVDCVVTTLMPDGRPAVLLSRRAPGKCFGGCWWIHGGSLHAYRPIEAFIQDRVLAEVGIEPLIDAVVGVYRTCAEDFFASTLNLCVSGVVDYGSLTTACKDADHTALSLFTLDQYLDLDMAVRHPYIDRVVILAINSYPLTY